MTQEEMMAKLAELEAENQKLKAAKKAKEVPTTVSVNKFKGRDILSFSGSFRPFSMGNRKIRVVLENLDALKKFVMEHPMNDDVE